MEEIKEVIRIKKLQKNVWAETNKINAKYVGSNGSSSKTYLCVPVDGKTGQLKEIFTPSEKKELIKILGLNDKDLDPNSDWMKGQFFTYEGAEVVLDLQNPIDKIYYNIIKANTSRVAFGEDELTKKANAEFILYNDVEKNKKQAKKTNLKAEAYSLFTKMSQEEKKGILICLGKKISGASSEVIDSEVGRAIEKDPSEILNLYNDKQFKEIVFVQTLLIYGIIKSKREGIVDNDEFLGSDINQAINYLTNPENKLKLETYKRELKEKQSK